MEYNGSTTDTNPGWDTGVSDLNVFYDVSIRIREPRRSRQS